MNKSIGPATNHSATINDECAQHVTTLVDRYGLSYASARKLFAWILSTNLIYNEVAAQASYALEGNDVE